MEKLLFIAHLLAIATGTGLSFANYINLRVAASESAEHRAALAALRRQILQVMDVIIVLIWATGLSLLWGVRPEINAWFHVKLAFVLLLTIFHFGARRTAGQMLRTGDKSLHARLEFLMAGIWVSAAAAISLAVVAFET
jgi:putative membrane protein